jgi:hypothetical protein
MNTKKVIRWFIINSILLGLFIYAMEYNSELAYIITVAGFTIMAILGILLGILGVIIGSNKVEIVLKEQVSDDPEKFKKFLKKDPNDTFSVPPLVDAIYDIGVSLIMVYYGFTWLPILYLLHIIGLWYFRDGLTIAYSKLKHIKENT